MRRFNRLIALLALAPSLAWAQVWQGGGGATTLSGPAGGVLSGTYPNPGVVSATPNAFLTGNGTGAPNAVPMLGLVFGLGSSAPPQGVPNCAGGVLGYSSGGVPSCNTTLPTSLTLPSPNLTGTPTAATASTGTSTTQVATTQFVQSTTGGPVLSGTSGSIGGSPLAAGACVAGVVSVTGARSTMVATTSPSSDPDNTLTAGVAIYAFVSANDLVTVRVCAIVALTPIAATYNVRILQ